MFASTSITDTTWRLLWAHTAHLVINELPESASTERVSAGLGWGIRRKDNPRQAILIHPTANQREVGDLSLTVLGQGTQVIPRAGLASAAVVTLAVIQILVQTGAFLHVNSRAQGGWTLIAYVFTAVLLLITIAGSVWIMYHLNVNMMPGMMQADPPVNQPP